MSTVSTISGTMSIGEVAGKVWHCLHSGGPATYAQLAKEVDAPRDLVMQAVGWLAREQKVDIEASARRKTVVLREEM